MEGGRRKGKGGTEKLFHAPQRKCITGITVETSRKSTVGVLELVRDSSAKWRLWDGEAIEIRSGEAEMNEKEVLRERRVKDSSRGWGMGVRKAICHFPLRGPGHQRCIFKRIPPDFSPVFKCLSSVASRGQMATPANSTAEISLERVGQKG